MLDPQKGNKQIPKRNLLKYKKNGKVDRNKRVQDLKVEIESIKETQSEGNLKMKNLGARTLRQTLQ